MTFALPNLTSITRDRLRLEVFEGPDALMRAKRDWVDLCRQGGASTAFQSFEVATACTAAHLRRGETPRIVIGRRDGRSIVIIPLVVTKWLGASVVRFLGDPLIQYGDILVAPDVSKGEITTAWERALSVKAAVALLRRVRDDAHSVAFLAERQQICPQETALVDLRQAPRLSSRNARELKRLQRRLAEHGAVEVQFTSGSAGERTLKKTLDLKRKWMRKNALASAVIGDNDWEMALGQMLLSGALCVASLTVNGHLVAAELALLDGKSWYGFLGAFDSDFAKMGPGHVLTAECLSRARSDGLLCFDQLPPIQAYKCEQATHMLSVNDYILPFSSEGRLVAAAVRYMPELKTAFASLPMGLRQTVLALMGR